MEPIGEIIKSFPPTSWEPGTWICEKCGEKNYYVISSDIIYLNDKMRIWDPDKGGYREEEITWFKCGALHPSVITIERSVECPYCHKKFIV